MPCIVVLTLLLNKKEQSVKSNGQQAQFFQNKGGVGVNASSSPCCPLLPSCAGRRLLCHGAAAAPGLLVAPPGENWVRFLALDVPKQEVSSAPFSCKKYPPRGKFTVPFLQDFRNWSRNQEIDFTLSQVASIAEVLTRKLKVAAFWQCKMGNLWN